MSIIIIIIIEDIKPITINYIYTVLITWQLNCHLIENYFNEIEITRLDILNVFIIGNDAWASVEMSCSLIIILNHIAWWECNFVYKAYRASTESGKAKYKYNSLCINSPFHHYDNIKLKMQSDANTIHYIEHITNMYKIVKIFQSSLFSLEAKHPFFLSELWLINPSFRKS